MRLSESIGLPVFWALLHLRYCLYRGYFSNPGLDSGSRASIRQSLWDSGMYSRAGYRMGFLQISPMEISQKDLGSSADGRHMSECRRGGYSSSAPALSIRSALPELAGRISAHARSLDQ